jgi:hypothetical protein
MVTNFVFFYRITPLAVPPKGGKLLNAPSPGGRLGRGGFVVTCTHPPAPCLRKEGELVHITIINYETPLWLSVHSLWNSV